MPTTPRAKALMKALAKACAIAAVLAVTALSFTGCLRPPDSSNTKSSTSNAEESAAYPIEYYEGYWVCSGYERDGALVAFSDLSEEEKASFPYLVLEVDGNTASISQITNDEGEYQALVFGECYSTSDGIRIAEEIGSFGLILTEENLVLTPEEASRLESNVDDMGLYLDYSLPQRDAAYYFYKLGIGSQLRVATFEFDDISIDVPVDVAYSLCTHRPETNEDGSVSISGTAYRRYGPHMDFFSNPTEASSIAEVIAEVEGRDYCIEHADEFTEYEGVLYHVHHDEERDYSRLGFVANGKLYEIDFIYEDEDVVDYSDYCKHFFATIKFVGGEANEEPSEGIPTGAISWQEAPQHVGETVTVYGPVAEIDYASTSDGQPTFVDLGVAYPDQSRVTMVIWGEDRGSFPDNPEVMYAGKTLCVTGEVYLHEGVCNIKVTSPSQVQIVSG